MRTSVQSRFERFSIKSLVAISATALLSLALIVGSLALSGLQQRSLLQEVDVGLDDRIAGIADNYAVQNAEPKIPLTGREAGVVQVFSGKRIVAATPGLLNEAHLNQFTPTNDVGHRTFRIAVGESDIDRWRIAARQIQTTSGPIDIYAATSLESADRTTARLRTLLLSVIPFLVLAFGVISFFTTKWSLAPVDRLRRKVDTMSPTDADLGRVLAEPRANDEVANLVRTVNSLLTRVAEARKRERRFAADASHELRTPLATARLNLEIAQSNPTHDNLSFAVNETLVEVDRLETLARDLLELTRLDHGRTQEHSQVLDIRAMLQSEVAASKLRRSDLEYRIESPDSVDVLAVTGLVLRVIRNLIENAQRHARALVEVTVAHERGMVKVTIFNDGDSIDPADRKRIFDPFTRLDDARARDDGGTGLGLAIAADIVEAHGGTIAVIDDQRTGAAFAFTLPAAL